MALQNTNVRVCEGIELCERVPPEAQQAGTGIRVDFTGKNTLSQGDKFSLSEKLLSQHLLLVGGIGSGKTNTFNEAPRPEAHPRERVPGYGPRLQSNPAITYSTNEKPRYYYGNI